MSREIDASVCYFGKVPSRGDFVRATDNHQLLAWLDRWAGAGVESLSRNPDWKRVYDEAPEVHYAFLGSRSRTVLCGHLVPSRDASQRRFPFLSAVRFEVAEPLRFIGLGPLAMAKAWSGLARQSRQAVAEEAALAALAETRYSLSPDVAAYQATFNDFLEIQTLASLQGLLADAGHAQASLRQVLPALGLLLQPLLTGGALAIDRALAFPLPRDPLYRPLVAAFWLELVAAFLVRGDFEMAVLLRDARTPELLVGFGGADPAILHAALDPQQAGEFLIQAGQAEWVDDYVAGDYALNRLSGLLERDDTSLKTARRLLGETFLGT
ncbi:type VI secretion system-associated protein TagF [Xanthomonas massiliensis]|uniref:type VI secretion system-associated protein TagF n=1 Tax=Xanthomonas massiliensis TaxID=1720302 RepID=UPI00082470CA|nr:type VI secretion system-associated protein TagF [Xanthomonas massiliensis]